MANGTVAGEQIPQSFADRVKSGIGQPRQGPNAGLFSVDASLPEDWERTVQEQRRFLSELKSPGGLNPTEVDSRGIPVAWDYRASKTGPWGEPLPQTAQGWLPTGEPDFGAGVDGWWKKTLYKINEDRSQEDDSPAVKDILANLRGNILDSAAASKKKKQEGAEIGEQALSNLGVLGTAALGGLGALIGIIKSGWHGVEGEQITPLTAIPRIIGATFDAAGTALQAEVEAVEREVVGPGLLASAELADKYKLVSQEEIDGWDNWLGQIGVFPVWGRVQYNILTGRIPREEFYQTKKAFRNQEAARIAYTAWKDAAVKGEFIRRMRAGEDPRLLALELEDPVDEMVLEFVFDPLNALDVIYGAGKVLTAGTRAWAKINRGRVAVDLLDTARDIERAADAGDLAELGRLVERVGPVIDDGVQTVLKGEVAAAGKRGLFRRLQTSNQLIRAEDMNNVLMDILRAVDENPDRAVDVMRSLSLLISPDNAEKVEGISRINALLKQNPKLDWDLILSDEGIRSAVIFRDIALDDAGKFSDAKLDALYRKAQVVIDESGEVLRKAKKADLDKVSDIARGERRLFQEEGAAREIVVSQEELFNSFDKNLNAVLAERFPVIEKHIEQNEELALLIEKHGENSKQAIDYIKRHPVADVQVDPLLKKLLPFHQTANKWFYKPSALVQSRIFMGLNPGYAMRNRIGNSVAILANEGFSPAFRALMPRVFGGKEKSIRTVKDWAIHMPVGLGRSQSAPHAAFQLGKDASQWGPVLRTAQEDEKLARIAVAAKVIPEVMRNALHPRRALNGIRDVLRSDEDTKLFVRLSKLHKGDLYATRTAFRELRGTDIGRTLDAITDYDMYFIEKLGLEEDIYSLLRDASKTQPEVAQDLRNLIDDYAEIGLRAGTESVLDDLEELPEVQDTINLLSEELSDLGADEFERRVNARSVWREQARKEVNDALLTAKRQIGDDILNVTGGTLDDLSVRTAIEEGRRTLDTMQDEVFRATESLMDKTRSKHRTATRLTRKISDEAKSYTDDILRNIWEGGDRGLRFGTKRFALGPAGLDIAEIKSRLRERLWDVYREVLDQAYYDTSVQTVDALQDVVDGIHQYVGYGEAFDGVATGVRKATDDAGVIAKLMQRAIVDEDTGMSVVRVTQTELDTVLSQKYAEVLQKSEIAGGMAEGGEVSVDVLDHLDELRELYGQNPDLSPNDLWNYLDKIDHWQTDPLKGALRGIVPTEQRAKELLAFMIKEPFGEVDLPVAAERLAEILPADVHQELIDIFGRAGEDAVEAVSPIEDATESLLAVMAGEQPDGAERLQRILEENPEVRQVLEEMLGPEGVYDIPVVGPMDGATPSAARFAYETTPTMREVINRVIGAVEDEWQGGIEGKALDPITEARLDEWMPGALKNVERARTEASRRAVAAGDFAMHNYGDRMGIDLLTGYIFPYQFWYSRSYAKWMQRAVRHPGLAGAYLRYKDTLAKLHAGLPDWWKYQLNTNELLGMDSQHPLWFNLEALVNPVHGLTGVDFEDPKRRVDAWGAWMEDLNKFGPTVWAPYQLALAAKYSLQGEEEAAARWAGRILPFSQTVRNATALMGVNEDLGIEIDPYVHLFGGGIEAYERGRVGRQLGLMMDEGQFPQADIIDATYNQDGDIWNLAQARTIQERAPNMALAVAPFFFGVGAKARNVKDQAIDRMYGHMDGLIKNRENMSADEYRTAWQQLRQSYPFMDTVLMSKKAGFERDEALAWNVLSRIPPGASRRIAEDAGIERKDLDAFYENKGDLTLLTEAERMRFMAAVLDIGGLLDLPSGATRAEWDISKNLYREMRTAGQAQFGEDIWDLVDIYYASLDEDDPDVGREFLRTNPMVSDALDWQQVMIQNTPLLAAYYTSAERIRKFYKSQMYQTAEELFGQDLWDNFEIYSRLKDMGEDKAASEFWKATPDLGGYMDFKEQELPVIEEKVDNFETIIPESKPAKYRHEDYDIVANTPITDEREASIMSQVTAYADAYSNYSGQKPDIKQVVREQADEIWPNTRGTADHYYRLVEGQKNTEAAAYLKNNPELQPRILWEFDKVQRMDLAAAGNLFQSAGAAPGLEQQLATPPGIDPNSPLGRLWNDPQGIPEHLWREYLLYGQ